MPSFFAIIQKKWSDYGAGIQKIYLQSNALFI